LDHEEVTKHLRAALEHERRVDLHHDRIEVEYADGVATLSGEVGNVAAKRVTLELAARLPKIAGIVDRLHVRPAEPMGDGEIADHLERALAGDSVFGECALYRRIGQMPRATVRSLGAADRRWWIELRVDEGIVTLDGDVPSLSHKRLAGALAWWVPGSRDVVNGLGVEPSEEDTDQEILDGLRLVLEKDPLIDASRITARCKGAVVTLRGLCPDESHRELAEFDAWALFGVDGVVNEIQVGRR
jgi:osmotically-inducible protein OsmY